MKIGELFEKYVQWIALGLAGAWLVWVGWTYGVNRPEIQIGSEKFSPGSVDEHILNGELNQLMVRVNNLSVPAGLVDVPDFTDAFVSAMNGKAPAPAPAMVFNSAPQFQSLTTPDNKLPIGLGPKVAELPEVVQPTDPTPGSGRSLAMVPPPTPKLPANNNGNAAAADAGRPNIFNNPAPQPQPVGPNGAVLPVGVQTDKTWVTVFAKFNANKQAEEFKRVKIPLPLMQQIYTEVQLQRQEVLPNGNLGPLEVVRGLTMNEPPVDRKVAMDFIAWASGPQPQQMIVQPKFYDVVKGTAWELPHGATTAVVENATPQSEQFNVQDAYQTFKSMKPVERLKWLMEKLTPEQRKEFNTYRQVKDAEEAKAKAGQRPAGRTPTPPRTGGTGGGPRPGGGYDVVDPQLLREMFADDDSQIRPRRPGREDMDNPYQRRYNGPRGYVPRRPVTDGEIMQPQQPGLMVGNMVPDVNGNIDIWAHDETAQPGRTYHYRVRVVLKNPIYNTNAGTDPRMNQEPYLPIDPEKGWSEWSKPVAIPTNVDMMLVQASNLGGKETAKFVVKRFQEGQVNTSPQPFVVSPGDVIGGPEKVVVAPAAAAVGNPPPLINPVGAAAAKPMVVDFTTNWTLVDIRQVGNGGDYRVRIMDAQGRMEMRTVSGDAKRFKDETAAPRPAVGPVGMRTP